MATVVVTSDLHLGITSERTLRAMAEDIALEQPDLTILAGDLGEPFHHFVRCLNIFANLPGEVAVLSGNHDIWACEGHSSKDLWERDLPEATRGMGMLWLEDTIWQCEKLGVVGSLAWYDYSAVDPTLAPLSPPFYAENKSKYNLDGKRINWDWSDVDFATRLGDGLCERLQILDHDASVQTIFVVTHVPLFEEQILRKPGDMRWSFGNAYFGNLTTGQRIIDQPKLTRVISGHTHVGRGGVIQRDQLPPFRASVIPSDYNSPAYVVARDTDVAT